MGIEEFSCGSVCPVWSVHGCRFFLNRGSRRLKCLQHLEEQIPMEEVGTLERW
jgi:hypothetical protein